MEFTGFAAQCPAAAVIEKELAGLVGPGTVSACLSKIQFQLKFDILMEGLSLHLEITCLQQDRSRHYLPDIAKSGDSRCSRLGGCKGQKSDQDPLPSYSTLPKLFL